MGGDFAEHAARQFRPRLIVLIVPPSVPVRRRSRALLLRHAACQGFQARNHLPAVRAHLCRCTVAAHGLWSPYLLLTAKPDDGECRLPA